MLCWPRIGFCFSYRLWAVLRHKLLFVISKGGGEMLLFFVLRSATYLVTTADFDKSGSVSNFCPSIVDCSVKFALFSVFTDDLLIEFLGLIAGLIRLSHNFL